jgi:hypothetical protein
LLEDADPVAVPNIPLPLLHALPRSSRYAITMLTIGSVAFYCIVFGLWQFLFGCVGDDPLKVLINADVGEEAASVSADRDVVADDHLSEDVDDGVVDGQGDEPVEAPVATATIPAPLRRSKRVAAQLSRASCSEVVQDVPQEVALSMCATSPRRSARLAAKPRVAAQLSRASCSEVAREVPQEVALSICATSPRRSARLAAKLRVNGKPQRACR